jgi:hypothetical protein
LAQVQLAHRPRLPFVFAGSLRVREAISKVQEVQIARDRLNREFGVREELLKGSRLFTVFIDFGTELNRAVKEIASQEATKEPTPVQTIAPEQTAVVVNETKSRGLLAAMMGTLNVAQAGSRNVTGTKQSDAENEFTRAFAKVQKIML